MVIYMCCIWRWRCSGQSHWLNGSKNVVCKLLLLLPHAVLSVCHKTIFSSTHSNSGRHGVVLYTFSTIHGWAHCIKLLRILALAPIHPCYTGYYVLLCYVDDGMDLDCPYDTPVCGPRTLEQLRIILFYNNGCVALCVRVCRRVCNRPDHALTPAHKYIHTCLTYRSIDEVLIFVSSEEHWLVLTSQIAYVGANARDQIG